MSTSVVTPLRWVLRRGRSGRWGLVVAALTGALAAGCVIGLTAVAAWLIVRANEHPPVLHLMVAVVAVRAFGIGRGVLRYLERLSGHDAALRILGDLRVATVERLARVLPARADRPAGRLRSGELLSRFVADVDGLQDVWVRVLVPYVAAAIAGAGAVVLLAVLVPAAGIVLAVTLVLSALLAPRLSIRADREATLLVEPRRAAYQTAALDVLDGATELRVYGALDDRLTTLTGLDRSVADAEARTARAAGWGGALAVAAGGVAMWAGLWFGVGAVRSGAMATVTLAVVALVPLAAHEVFGGLSLAGQQVPALAASAERVRAVLDEPDSVPDPTDPASVPSGPYGIRVRDLTVRWQDDGRAALTGIDLDLAAGDSTVITAPSGAGKSTLAAVLMRLLEPVAGRVELLGASAAVDVADLRGDDVRALIGWAAQDAHVFDSTIEANLRLARPEATADDLHDALCRARLDGWVATLPDGMATMVGEHGRALSGGQRQRLALARVILADRPIVLLDEPTEHLDEPTAAALAADLIDTTRGRTVIVLTHRPELFGAADHTVALG